MPEFCKGREGRGMIDQSSTERQLRSGVQRPRTHTRKCALRSDNDQTEQGRESRHGPVHVLYNLVLWRRLRSADKKASSGPSSVLLVSIGGFSNMADPTGAATTGVAAGGEGPRGQPPSRAACDVGKEWRNFRQPHKTVKGVEATGLPLSSRKK